MKLKKTVKLGLCSLGLALTLAAGTSIASAHPAAVAGWIVGGIAAVYLLNNANNGYYNYYPAYDYGYYGPTYYNGYYNNGYNGYYGYSYSPYYSGYWY